MKHISILLRIFQFPRAHLHRVGGIYIDHSAHALEVNASYDSKLPVFLLLLNSLALLLLLHSLAAFPFLALLWRWQVACFGFSTLCQLCMLLAVSRVISCYEVVEDALIKLLQGGGTVSLAPEAPGSGPRAYAANSLSCASSGQDVWNVKVDDLLLSCRAAYHARRVSQKQSIKLISHHILLQSLLTHAM